MPTHLFSRIRSCLSLVLLLGGSSLFADSKPRAALMDFTSNDGLYGSARVAADFGVLVSGELMGDSGVEWVERARLEKIKQEQSLLTAGLASKTDAIKLGKWAKADLVILGRFVQNEKEGHTLQLEVVDLDHADILWSKDFFIPGDRRSVLVLDPQLLKTAVESLKAGLSESVRKLKDLRGKTIIAPLFFQNIDRSSRLNGFQDALFDSFRDKAAKKTDFRMLHFSKAHDASAESELVLMGLSDVQWKQWESVADVYVWAVYHEKNPDGLEFGKVPVELTLYLWNGLGDPHEHVEVSTVAELPGLASRAAQYSIDWIEKNKPVQITDDSRAKIGAWLEPYAKKKKRELEKHKANKEFFVKTPEGKASVSHLLRILEMGCFFQPSARYFQEEYQGLKWSDWMGSSDSIRPFFSEWEKTMENGEFLRNYSTWSETDSSSFIAYLQNLVGLLDRINTGTQIPVDAEMSDLKAWREEIEVQLLKDTRVLCFNFAKSSSRSKNRFSYFLAAVLKQVRDDGRKAQMIELIWPLCRSDYFENPSRINQYFDVPSGFRDLYQRLGRPGKAGELLSDTGAKPETEESSIQKSQRVFAEIKALYDKTNWGVQGEVGLYEQKLTEVGFLLSHLKGEGGSSPGADPVAVEKMRNSLAEEFVRGIEKTNDSQTSKTVSNYHCRICLKIAMRSLEDPQAKARVVEKLWPRYRPFFFSDPQEKSMNPNLPGDIRELFKKLGCPERAEELLKEDVDPVPVSQFRPVFHSLPFKGFLDISQSLPQAPSYSVSSMRFVQGSLWIGAVQNRVFDNNPASALLLKYDPALDLCEKNPWNPPSNSIITSFVGSENQVWMTDSISGVSSFDPEGGKYQSYGTQEGILTMNMRMSGETPRALYFAGFNGNHLLINEWERALSQWKRLELDPTSLFKSQNIRAAGPDVATLEFLTWSGSWLSVGLNPSILYHQDSKEIFLLQSLLGKAFIPGSSKVKMDERGMYMLQQDGIYCCAADKKGFWYGANDGLYFLDPETKKTSHVKTRGIQSLFVDGDYIWASSTEFRLSPQFRMERPRRKDPKSRILLFHKPTLSMVASFEIPGVVRHIAASKSDVYLGMDSTDQLVFEFSKRSVFRVFNLPFQD